jgi:pimeloyl-ACP methyl ester carboxylesterase
MGGASGTGRRGGSRGAACGASGAWIGFSIARGGSTTLCTGVGVLAVRIGPMMKDIAPRVLAMIPMHDDYVIPLEQIRAETLFLWTTDNPVHDVETARRSAAQVPSAKLCVMKADAAHWPQYEAPEEFNGVVARFLASGEI